MRAANRRREVALDGDDRRLASVPWSSGSAGGSECCWGCRSARPSGSFLAAHRPDIIVEGDRRRELEGLVGQLDRVDSIEPKIAKVLPQLTPGAERPGHPPTPQSERPHD